MVTPPEEMREVSPRWLVPVVILAAALVAFALHADLAGPRNCAHATARRDGGDGGDGGVGDDDEVSARQPRARASSSPLIRCGGSGGRATAAALREWTIKQESAMRSTYQTT